MDIDLSAPTDPSDQTLHATISRHFKVGERHSQGRVRRYLLRLGRSFRKISGVMLDPKCSVSCNISIDNLPRLLIPCYFSQLAQARSWAGFTQGGFPQTRRRLTYGVSILFPRSREVGEDIGGKTHCLSNGGLLGQCSVEDFKQIYTLGFELKSDDPMTPVREQWLKRLSSA